MVFLNIKLRTTAPGSDISINSIVKIYSDLCVILTVYLNVYSEGVGKRFQTEIESAVLL